MAGDSIYGPEKQKHVSDFPLRFEDNPSLQNYNLVITGRSKFYRRRAARAKYRADTTLQACLDWMEGRWLIFPKNCVRWNMGAFIL